MRIFRTGAGEDGSGERSSTLFVTTNGAAGSEQPRGDADDPYLTLSFLPFLLIAGGVGLQRVAAAVERIVAVFIIQDARKADLPLVAVTAELRIQAQAAAVQVLKTGDALPRVMGDGDKRNRLSRMTTNHKGLSAWPW